MNRDRSDATRRSVRIVWLLIAAFVLTIASFVAATTVAEYRARGIEAAAESITTNALPSIACLSGARTELRQVELMLERLTDTDGPIPKRDPTADRAVLDSSREAFARYWSTCISLPVYPGERALQERIASRTREMNDSIEVVLSAIAAGKAEAAARELADHTQPAFDHVDAAMVETIELNARHSAALGADIASMRTSSKSLREFLVTLSVILASVAAFLMVRLLRRFTGLMESRVLDMEQFAGRVAHDVRSPLTSIGLALELTKRDPAAGIERGLLDRASATLQRVGQLVDGLLVFARSGEAPEASASSNIGEVLSGVVDEMRPSAEANGIELQLEQLECEDAVACSSGVLISLVSNIVGNAIKHMGSAPIRRVNVRVRDLGRRVRFEICDTGPGVPPAMRERIFDPYVRAAESSVPGIGLGLATVRRLVEAHGGTVGVLPNEGPGSLFWFELPKARSESTRRVWIRPGGLRPSARG
ncbi:MAG: sensory transduction histidine kinase [Labilithrix sp.]|nr:sensory transduction histidine kinase [Labilithrix sp.]